FDGNPDRACSQIDRPSQPNQRGEDQEPQPASLNWSFSPELFDSADPESGHRARWGSVVLAVAYRHPRRFAVFHHLDYSIGLITPHRAIPSPNPSRPSRVDRATRSGVSTGPDPSCGIAMGPSRSLSRSVGSPNEWSLTPRIPNPKSSS